ISATGFSRAVSRNGCLGRGSGTLISTPSNGTAAGAATGDVGTSSASGEPTVCAAACVDAVSAITAMAAYIDALIKAIPPFALGRSEHQLEPRPPRHRPWPFQLTLVRSVN